MGFVRQAVERGQRAIARILPEKKSAKSGQSMYPNKLQPLLHADYYNPMFRSSVAKLNTLMSSDVRSIEENVDYKAIVDIANAGHARALCTLARAFETGKLRPSLDGNLPPTFRHPQNTIRAFELYEASARQGDALAQIYLGAMHVNNTIPEGKGCLGTGISLLERSQRKDGESCFIIYTRLVHLEQAYRKLLDLEPDNPNPDTVHKLGTCIKQLRRKDYGHLGTREGYRVEVNLQLDNILMRYWFAKKSDSEKLRCKDRAIVNLTRTLCGDAFPYPEAHEVAADLYDRGVIPLLGRDKGQLVAYHRDMAARYRSAQETEADTRISGGARGIELCSAYRGSQSSLDCGTSEAAPAGVLGVPGSRAGTRRMSGCSW